MIVPTLRRAAFLCTSLMFALTLVACGNGSTGTGNTGSTTTTGGTTSTTPAGTCVPGTSTVNGINTITFCGTAKGSVTVSGQTYTLTGGKCLNIEGQVGVNIGHAVLDPSNSDAGNTLKKQYDYLGVTVAASQDGTYDHATIAGYSHGVDFTSVGSLTLTHNLQAGSFTGTAILSHAAVSGTFTCA